MKKILIATGIWAAATVMVSCGGAKGNNPGDAYMPDMYYSRAYETYGYNNVNNEYQSLKDKGVNYTGIPVKGTIARGDQSPFPYAANDSGYQQSKAFANPMAGVTMSPAQMQEAERIYLVNCAICHGTKLDGNGPLWKDGNGPFPALPRPLVEEYAKALADGQMYHTITYGKGQMGSYASQVHPEQRWWVINYIRSKQGRGATASDSTVAVPAANAPAAGTATDVKPGN